MRSAKNKTNAEFVFDRTSRVLVGALLCCVPVLAQGAADGTVAVRPRVQDPVTQKLADYQAAEDAWQKVSAPLEDILKLDSAVAHERVQSIRSKRAEADDKAIAMRTAMREETRKQLTTLRTATGRKNVEALRTAADGMAGFLEANRQRLQDEIKRLEVNPAANAGILSVLHDQLSLAETSKSETDQFVRKITEIGARAGNDPAYSDLIASLAKLNAALDEQIKSDQQRKAAYAEFYTSLDKQVPELAKRTVDPGLPIVGNWIQREGNLPCSDSQGTAYTPNVRFAEERYETAVKGNFDTRVVGVLGLAPATGAALTVTFPVSVLYWSGPDKDTWDTDSLAVTGAQPKSTARVELNKRSEGRLDLTVTISGAKSWGLPSCRFSLARP